MSESTFDVVVIGAGPGGGSTAWALAQAGVKVAILDAGPAYDYLSDYRLHSTTWEQTLFPSRADEHGSYVFAPLQELEARWSGLRSWNHITGLMNKSSRRKGWRYHHVQGVGGTTLHFLGEAHRLNSEAMRMQSRFGVAADWPVDYSALEPYYLKAERIIGVAGPEAVPWRRRSAPYPLPAHLLSYASRKVEIGCRRLGLTLSPNTLAILSDSYDERPPCNYCANCIRGCPRADKGSVDVTFVAKAQKSGRCVVRPHSQVLRLQGGSNDRVKAILYADQDGLLHKVTGRVIVVSCGAVHTPRLLLASDGPRTPEGFANESGQVGRNFMETLFWTASGLHPDQLGSHRGLPADSMIWDFNAPDAIPDVVGGCVFSPGAALADLTGPIGYATRVVPGWGRQHREQMRATFGRILTISGIGESLPNPDSYVDLAIDRLDRHGLPLPRIHSRLDDLELRRLMFMADTARTILDASGVKQIIEEYGTYDIFSSTHVFGTCRMGQNPDRSVVDPFCRSHRWRNLFIVDASVFPSSGGGESPSLTIEALGIRTGEYIRTLLQRGDL